MKVTETAGEAIPCPKCRAQAPATLLVCPACGALLHGDRLKDLAAQAGAAEQSGDFAAALATWREALTLLPPGSNQHTIIIAKLDSLGKQVDSGDLRAPQTAAAASSLALGSTLQSPAQPHASSHSTSQPHMSASKKSGIVAIGALLIGILSKGKFLLMGLTKASTFFSMFLSFGVYWSVWGWKFAAGLVVSIYIHEMGHVVALRKFGIRATAPMFIPGLGAFIRLKDYPHDARGDARTGLAGPVYGLGAAFAAYVIHLATGWGSFAAIAKIGAWINLFNLIPIYPLDGGHGFRALATWQRFAIALLCGATWYLGSHFTAGRHADGMLAIVGVVALFRAFQSAEMRDGDNRTLAEFAVLIVALGALAALPVPGQP